MADEMDGPKMSDSLREIAVEAEWTDKQTWDRILWVLDRVDDLIPADLARAIIEAFEAEGDDDLAVHGDEQDLDPDGVPTEPSPEDLVTGDYLFFYEHESPKHKPVLILTEDDSQTWQDAVSKYMDRVKFWPNVWYRGERGDWNLLDVTTGTFAKP